MKKNKTEYLLFRLKCCCLRYLPAKENIKAKGNGVSIPLPSIPMPTSPAFVTCVGVCFRSLYAASHALPSCCNAYKPRTLQLKANIAIQLIRLKSKHHLYVIPLLYQLTTTYSNARRLIFYPRIHLASYLCAHTLRSVGSFNFMVFFFSLVYYASLSASSEHFYQFARICGAHGSLIASSQMLNVLDS